MLHAALLSVLVVGGTTAGQIHQAVRARDLATLHAILQRADPILANDRIPGNITALHLAAATDQAAAAQMLLERGATVDARNDSNFTPLHWAASRDAAAVAAVLIEAGAVIEARARGGLTPLHCAAAKSATNVVALLLQHGANIGATTDTGFIPVHLAVKANSHGQAALLLAQAQVAAEVASGLPVLEAALPDPAAGSTNDISGPADALPETLPPPEKGSFLNVAIGLGETLAFVWVERLQLWVGKFEITNRQYRRCWPNHRIRTVEGLALDDPDQPVVQVSWLDADAFCAWLNTRFGNRIPPGMVFRLPSDLEWTVIASCGDARRYPWGNDWPPRYGNFSDTTAREQLSQWRGIAGYNDGYPVTCPVQHSGMNEWGVYGLGGNVWEWTSDWFDSAHQFRSRRGGSWSFDTRPELEIAAQGFDRPNARYDTIGFRVVVAQPR